MCDPYYESPLSRAVREALDELHAAFDNLLQREQALSQREQEIEELNNLYKK